MEIREAAGNTHQATPIPGGHGESGVLEHARDDVDAEHRRDITERRYEMTIEWFGSVDRCPTRWALEE